jgi:hypothetical protein
MSSNNLIGILGVKILLVWDLIRKLVPKLFLKLVIFHHFLKHFFNLWYLNLTLISDKIRKSF